MSTTLAKVMLSSLSAPKQKHMLPLLPWMELRFVEELLSAKLPSHEARALEEEKLVELVVLVEVVEVVEDVEDVEVSEVVVEVETRILPLIKFYCWLLIYERNLKYHAFIRNKRFFLYSLGIT